MFPYIYYRSSGEKLLKCQENLTWMIMFSILMSSLTDKPLILQWEIWHRSLLGLWGLIKYNNLIKYKNFEISLVVFMPNITTTHAITYVNFMLLT